MTVKCLKTEYQPRPRPGPIRNFTVAGRARHGWDCSRTTPQRLTERAVSQSSKGHSRTVKIPAFNELEHFQTEQGQKSFVYSEPLNVVGPEMAQKNLSGCVNSGSRTLLTKDQVKILETYYLLDPKPSSLAKKQFAMETNLSSCHVANWFQNRRAKAKQLRKQQHLDHIRTSRDSEHNREVNDRQTKQRNLRQVRSCRSRNRSSDARSGRAVQSKMKQDCERSDDYGIIDASFPRPRSFQTFAILLHRGLNMSQRESVTNQTIEGTGLMQYKHNKVSLATDVVFRENDSDFFCVPLWKRFSRSTLGRKYRYARCKPADTEDYLGWLSWQQSGLPGTPSRHLKSPNWYLNISPTAIDISGCRKALSETMSKLSSPSDRYLVRILYIVAMSFSEFNVIEVYTALGLASTVDERNTSYTGPRLTPVQLIEVLHTSSEILKIDAEEVVSFHDPAMRDFLIGSGLADFETGHLMMGHIYLQLLEEAGLPNMMMPWLNFQEWYLQACDAPLANYMARYGAEHCRQAQQTHPEFCGDIHRSLLKACSGIMLPENSNEILTVNAQWANVNLCYEASIAYDFSELAIAYEEMGASLDPERPKILPETLTMTSMTQSDAIYALSAQRSLHSDLLPQLQFRPRLMSSQKNNDEVEKLEDALQTMDLSTRETSLQEDILAHKPRQRSESISTLASKLQSSYGSWLRRLEGKQALSANSVLTFGGSEMPNQTNLSDSDDSDWEVIECRVCQS